MRQIGIVGVGLLGSAVATRLLQRGFQLIGYDTRTAQQLYAAAAEAGTGAQDLAVVITQLERTAGLARAPH